MDLGMEGKSGLLVPVDMETSGPPPGVVAAGVPCPADPSTPTAGRRAGSSAGSSNCRAELWGWFNMNQPGRQRDHNDGSLLRRLDDFGRQPHIPSDDVGMTRPIGALSSSLMMTGRWLAVWIRPRWSWWQGSTIARWLMMLRGRGRRMGVPRLGNTAGLGTFPGAGTARVTWAGPLVLSPAGQLMSGRVLSIVAPVSSLTVRTPRCYGCPTREGWAVPS